MIEALDSLTRRNNYWLRMVGRLRPGVRLPQADAAPQPVYQQTMRDEAARTPGGPGPEGLAAATARADSGIARLFTRTRCARGIDPDTDACRRPDPADCVRQPGGATGVALGGPAAGIRGPTGDWGRRRSTGPAAPDATQRFRRPLHDACPAATDDSCAVPVLYVEPFVGAARSRKSSCTLNGSRPRNGSRKSGLSICSGSY